MRMRMRVVVLAAAVGAAGAGVVTACSTSAAGSAATSPAAHSPPRDAAPAPATEGSAAASDSRVGEPSSSIAAFGIPTELLPVGTRHETVIDRKRGSAARWPEPAHPYRVLPTTIFYPAASGGPSPRDSPQAQPRRGSYPLVVFAHGFNTNPEIYAPFLHALAEHGYVVAAPLFPMESFIPGAAAAHRSDPEMAAQMEDMSAVIDAVDEWAAQPWHWLHGAVDPSAVAVVGHSDGGITVGGMTMSSSYHDARIKAAVVMAGAPDPVLSYRGRQVVPTLVEQATEDPYNDPADAMRLYRSAVGPRAFLSVVGAQHLGPLVDDDRIADLVRRVVVSHLDMVFKGGGAASRQVMLDAGNQPGYDTLFFAG